MGTSQLGHKPLSQHLMRNPLLLLEVNRAMFLLSLTLLHLLVSLSHFLLALLSQLVAHLLVLLQFLLGHLARLLVLFSLSLLCFLARAAAAGAGGG